MNLLNEEIRVINHTMAHLKQAMSVEPDSGKRLKMQKDYKELEAILVDKLEKCEEF